MSQPDTDRTSAPLTLRDLLGALASDVTAARAQADAEAMRIARMYRGDALLRTLPAPLFRLADLTISLPLAITAVPGPAAAPPMPLARAAASILALVLGALAEHGGETGGALAAEIARALERERARLEREPAGSRDHVALADALLDAALGALDDVQRALLGAQESASGREGELRLAARARILALTPAPGVQIAATTAEIEAIGSPDALVQLRVNLSERGVQWAIGEHSERLVPE
jgi:hypothetical protein